MKRTNQGGSVLSFIIIGGVLTLLLVGGIYALRQYDRLSTIAVETPGVVAPEPGKGDVKSPASGDAATTGEQKADDKKTDSSEATETPAAIPGATSESTGSASANASDATATGGGSVAAGSTVDELPQTGPVQTASSLLAVSLLTGMSIAYMQSRRQSVRL